MILEKLRLKNFLIHKDSEIEFSENGITAFIGDNGAGKSSIVEAIAFALFGTRKDKKRNLADYVRWGTRQAQVELYFKLGDKRYKIQRTIEITGKRATSTAQVLVEKKGKFILDIQKNIDKEITRLTKLTYRVFSRSSLVKQGEIEGLIDLSSRERAKVFEDLLDLSMYQILSEIYGKKRRELEIEKETLSGSLSDLNQITEELKALQEESSKIVTQLASIKKQKEKLENHINKIEKQLEEKNQLLYENEKRLSKLQLLDQELRQKTIEIQKLQDQLEQIQRYKDQIEKLIPFIKQLEEKELLLQQFQELKLITEKLKDLYQRQKKIKEYEDIIKKYKDLNIQYQKEEKQLQEVQKQLIQLEKAEGEKKILEEELEKLKGKLKNTKKEALDLAKKLQSYKQIYKTLELNPVLINEFIKNNEEDIKKLEEEIKKVSAEEKYIKQKGIELKEKLKNIEKLEGKCPTCERPLDQHSKQEILKEINTEIQQLRDKYKKVQKQLKQLEENLKKEKEIKELLNLFKNIYEKHLEAKKEKDKIIAKYRLLEKKLEDKQHIEEKISNIQKFLQQNKEKIELFKQAERILENEDLENLFNEIKTLEEKHKNLSKKLENLNEEDLKKDINTLKQKKEEYIKLKAVIENEQNLRKEIDTLKKNINEIEIQLSQVKAQIIDTTKIKEEIEKLKKDLQNTKKDLKEKQENFININTQYTHISTVIKEKQNQIKKIEQTKEKIEKISEKIEKYKKLEKALGREGIQLVIRNQALTQLPVIMNNIFSKFEFPFKQIKLTDDFDIFLLAPTVEREDRYINVASISGGQKVALGLALRIAIGNLLSGKAEFMILDEPTIHLDQQRREDLISMMVSLKENQYIKQLIIITHDRELEDVADTIYFVREGTVEPVE